MRVVSAPSERAQAALAALTAVGPVDAVAPGLCLVLGGDGTMLRAIHAHPDATAFLGVNCGRLGFLMNDVEGDPAQVVATVLDALRADAWMGYRFPRLSVRVEAADGGLADLAVNDVYLERTTGQTCHLRVTVDGVVVVERLVCDGIIVATPLGSTAYSFSAGGPASHPLVHALHLTAICPHSPRLAPLVLPAHSRVSVEVLEPDRRPARVVVDGAQSVDAVGLEVRGEGPPVTLGFLAGHDFTATMIRKILHP